MVAQAVALRAQYSGTFVFQVLGAIAVRLSTGLFPFSVEKSAEWFPQLLQLSTCAAFLSRSTFPVVLSGICVPDMLQCARRRQLHCRRIFSPAISSLLLGSHARESRLIASLHDSAYFLSSAIVLKINDEKGLTGYGPHRIIRLPFDDGREESRAFKQMFFKN